MTSELVERALDAALVTRRPPPGLLHHSGRGSQYANYNYQARLRAVQVQVSMSRTGNCYANTPMDSLWAAHNTEIEGFHNLRRRHSTL